METKPENSCTKREHFAALALQGLLANGHAVYSATKMAVKAADELIKELNKTEIQ